MTGLRRPRATRSGVRAPLTARWSVLGTVRRPTEWEPPYLPASPGRTARQTAILKRCQVDPRHRGTALLKPTYPIETDRLLLRPCEPRDLDVMADIRSRADVVRYLYWQVQTRGEVAEALDRRMSMTALEKEGDGMVLAVELKETGLMIGDVVLQWLSEQHRQGETGFVFHPDFHGKGYALEASREMLRLGFDELGLHRIVGRCDARNTASSRLMERLGMRREAHFRENERFKGEWGDELVYAMLEGEWAARR